MSKIHLRALLLLLAASLVLAACDGKISNNNNDGTNPDGNTDGTNPDGNNPDGNNPDGAMDGDSMTDTVDPPILNEPDPNLIPQDQLFVCDGSASSSPSRLRRIERKEWVRAVGGSLSGYKASSVARTNPFDPPTTAPYTTWANGISIDATSLDLYFGVIGDSVTPWTARDARRTPRTYDDPGLRCMFDDANPDDACITYYLTSLLEDGVMYRPPTAGEMAHLRQFTDTVLADEVASGGTRPDSLRRVASAAWLMAGSLFRSEMGEGAADADGRYRLSDWEVARALSLFLSDYQPGAMGVYRFGEGPGGGSWTPPDAMAGYNSLIEEAARNGTIQDPAVIRSLVRAYATGSDPERFDINADSDPDRRSRRGEYWVSQKVHHFFQEWLGYTDVALVFKDTPYATSQFEDAMWDQGSITSSFGNLQHGYYGKESLLSEQLDDMIGRIVYEDADVFRTLLTSREFYIASSTAYTGSSIDKSTNEVHRPYGVTGQVDTNRWVTLPSDERAGVLTHPAFLASHGGNFEDDANVVHRGKWVREQLLCQTVPPLELVMVEAQLVPSDPSKRARDRIGESIEGKAECTWCHDQMNPLGYPFEIYNHAGFLRADDHGQAPDGSSVLVDMPDPALDGPIRDAVELSEKLADSDYAKRCFIRQSFRYFMGRNETLADACTLTQMEQAYDTSNGSFVAVLEALATSDTFLYRHHEMEEE